MSYDRRGHSASTAPERQGTIADDVADLVAILEHVGTPSVLVGHSYGATVCLLTTLAHPQLIIGAVVHEPPLFATLKCDPQHAALLESVGASMAEAARLIELGDLDHGVQTFVDDVAFGPGSWENVFNDHQRASMVANAGTWLDQYRDPDRLALSPTRLAEASRPLLITRGTQSPAIFGTSLDIALAGASNVACSYIEGAGHAAPLSHPDDLARVISDFVERLPTRG